MIPKEAIEAAISAYMKETDTEPHHLEGWFEPAMSAALTAAFSAMSEPVAWVSQNTLSTLADGHEGAFKEAISNKPFSRFSIPLYAAPQPAAVKVKPLEWIADGYKFRARAGDREYSLNITSDGETWAGSTRVYTFGANLTWSSVPNCSRLPLEDAKAAAQADHEARIMAVIEPPLQVRCRDCDGYNCDDGCAYPDTARVETAQDLDAENERLRAALEKIARRTSITFGAPHSMSAQEAFDIAKAALERT